MAPLKPAYSATEEIWNSATHVVGILFSVAALAVMVTLASIYGNSWAIVSCAIFGVSMTGVYTASSFYHAVPFERAKRILKKFDHIAIYYLIAGTYTPYTLVTLRGPAGWVMFGIVWAVAITGVVLNAVNLKKFAKISVVCYVALGWVILLATKTLVANLAYPGLVLLVAGGVAYTVGAVLYAIGSKKMYFHSIFHFFCLIGTVLHFFSIYFYVL